MKHDCLFLEHMEGAPLEMEHSARRVALDDSS